MSEETSGRRFGTEPVDAVEEDTDGPESLTRARRVAVGDKWLFGLSLLWTFLGTLVPGSGLLRAGRRVFGGFVLIGAVGTIAVAAVMWVAARRQLIGFAVDPNLLRIICAACIVIGLLWVGTIGVTHLVLRPANPSTLQRATGAVVVSILCFAIAAPLAVASQMAADQASFVETVFVEKKSVTKPSENAVDPWKGRPRLNVLLLGGDSGRHRNEAYGDRTDTVIVASIDTQTGQAVTFSLPRNTSSVPFPSNTPMHKRWPNGFTTGNPNNSDSFLNSIYENVPNILGKDVLGETDNVGADVLKLAVGEAFGLKIDYYLMVNLDGFTELVDALGGVRVNINRRIAIGGRTSPYRAPDGYFEIGPNQLLNGEYALWYARSRFGADDYDRMDRQRCVVNAVLKQANPAKVVTNYEAILKAGKHSVKTDIPKQMLPALVELGLKAKEKTLHSIVFKHGVDGFYSTHPNWTMVRQRVQDAIATPVEVPQPKPSAGSTPTTSSETGKATPKPSQTVGGGAENVDDACAYHPQTKPRR